MAPCAGLSHPLAGALLWGSRAPPRASGRPDGTPGCPAKRSLLQAPRPTLLWGKSALPYAPESQRDAYSTQGGHLGFTERTTHPQALVFGAPKDIAKHVPLYTFLSEHLSFFPS